MCILSYLQRTSTKAFTGNYQMTLTSEKVLRKAEVPVPPFIVARCRTYTSLDGNASTRSSQVIVRLVSIGDALRIVRLDCCSNCQTGIEVDVLIGRSSGSLLRGCGSDDACPPASS